MPGSPALAVVNPASGGGRGAALWRRVESRARRVLPGLTVQWSEGPGDTERIARDWALKEPAGSLLVAGGDGTVHEAVNGLIAAGSDQPLGVIPTGTGNDFARNAGIPLDPEAAVRRLQHSPIRRVDLGLLRFHQGGEYLHRIFLNSISFGVSVRANQLAQRLSRGLAGGFRYTLGGIAALWSTRLACYSACSGSRPLFSGPALNLTVANGASFGGGMRISPSSSFEDATLELVVLGPLGRMRALLALSRLRRGTHLGMRQVSVFPVREQLRLAGEPGLRCFEADGQEFLTDGDVTVDILPARLALLH